MLTPSPHSSLFAFNIALLGFPFTSAWLSLPSVAAEMIKTDKDSLEKPDLGSLFKKSSCSAIRALKNAREASKSGNLIGKSITDITNNHAVVVSNDPEDISTPKKAQHYLENIMGHPIPLPIQSCQGEDDINFIMNVKAPTLAQKEKLTEIYDRLYILADNDELASCNKKLIELLQHLDTNGGSYFIDTLRPLPEILATLISHAKANYTLSDLDLIVTKVHELSKKMIAHIQSTNEKEALVHWVDVLMKSGAKHANLMTSTFETALKLLQSNVGDSIRWDQKKELRMMARRHIAGAISQTELSVANKLLKITEPDIWLFRLFHSYLESFPENMKKVDESFQDIPTALAKSQTFYSTAALVVTAALWRLKKICRR